MRKRCTDLFKGKYQCGFFNSKNTVECTSRQHIFSKLLISVFEVIIVAVGLSMITSNSIITYTHFFLQKMLILAFELKRVYLSCRISVFFPVLVHSAWAWNTAAKICSSILVCVESPVWKNVPSFVNDRFFAHRWRCCWFVKKIYYIIILCIVNYDFFFTQKNAAVVISYEVYLDFLITKYIPHWKCVEPWLSLGLFYYSVQFFGKRVSLQIYFSLLTGKIGRRPIPESSIFLQKFIDNIFLERHFNFSSSNLLH